MPYFLKLLKSVKEDLCILNFARNLIIKKNDSCRRKIISLYDKYPAKSYYIEKYYSQ